MHAHQHTSEHTGRNERLLALAAALTGGFMIVELVGGVLAGSLALLADAGHMLTDFVSLALAWLGFRLARRPADWRRTYGFDRFSVLVAFCNGLSLLAIAAWICIEALQRLFAAPAVNASIMLCVGLAGLAVNLIGLRILHGGDPHNLNMRAAALHVAGDLLGSVAAVAAALWIMLTGWTPIDPLLSLLVCAIILRSALGVLRDSGHILLEGAPADLDARTISEDLRGHLREVLDVHHVHAWSITQSRPMVTLHARVAHGRSPEASAAAIKARLRQRFGVEHSTVEIEFGGCADDAHPH